MYGPIAFIELINRLELECIPFKIITKPLSERMNKAFITFPFMEGDVALFCQDFNTAKPSLTIETYDTPWDQTGEITVWAPEEKDINTLFQYIKMYWEDYSVAH